MDSMGYDFWGMPKYSPYNETTSGRNTVIKIAVFILFVFSLLGV